ncbi:MAG: hypothetical protein Fur0023_11550 [Bacteroidia bacterium]
MKKNSIKSENPWVYLQNAKNTLKEHAGKNGEFYQYPKYVRAAGHLAYMGVLVALDALMEKENIQIKHRKDVNDYRRFVASKNRKILNYFNEAYNYLHLLMGYDGSLLINTSKEGLKLATEIIEWVEKQLGKKWEKNEN